MSVVTFRIPNSRVAISVRRVMDMSYPNAQVGDTVTIEHMFLNTRVPVTRPIRLHGWYVRGPLGEVDVGHWESIRDSLDATGREIAGLLRPKTKRNWAVRKPMELPLP